MGLIVIGNGMANVIAADNLPATANGDNTAFTGSTLLEVVVALLIPSLHPPT